MKKLSIVTLCILSFFVNILPVRASEQSFLAEGNKMEKIKKYIGLLVLCTLFNFNVTSVQAAEISDIDSNISDTEMSKEELRSYYKIDELAAEYGMDVEELTDSFYKGIHSNKFSPFSEVASANNSTQGTCEYVKGRGLQRTAIAHDQESTMYLATGNKCASGVYPYVGCVAVHRKSSTNMAPVLPFGTRIYYENDSVNINGINLESFIVEDTGDPNYKRSTYYWTDVYGGASTEANRIMVRNYGVNKVDISW